MKLVIFGDWHQLQHSCLIKSADGEKSPLNSHHPWQSFKKNTLVSSFSLQNEKRLVMYWKQDHGMYYSIWEWSSSLQLPYKAPIMRWYKWQYGEVSLSSVRGDCRYRAGGEIIFVLDVWYFSGGLKTVRTHRQDSSVCRLLHMGSVPDSFTNPQWLSSFHT